MMVQALSNAFVCVCVCVCVCEREREREREREFLVQCCVTTLMIQIFMSNNAIGNIWSERRCQHHYHHYQQQQQCPIEQSTAISC